MSAPLRKKPTAGTSGFLARVDCSNSLHSEDGITVYDTLVPSSSCLRGSVVYWSSRPLDKSQDGSSTEAGAIRGW